MAVNRKIAPEFKLVDNLKFAAPEKIRLDNGVPLYCIDAGSQDVVRIELIYRAGLWYQHRALQASSVNYLITQGTSRLTAEEIAEKFDHYGSFLQQDVEKDLASISLFTLNKHLGETLPFLEEVIHNAIFPQDEFQNYVSTAKQRFIVNKRKVGVLARKHFNSLIFGTNHPYGRYLEEHHFDELTKEHAEDFYNRFYFSNNFTVICSGKIPLELPSLMNNHFGKGIPENLQQLDENIAIPTGRKMKDHVEVKGAVQSAIRIGRRLFTKDHPDYIPMQILNTVLGGYFGSRLMSNIREDKGYTYGIGSGVISFHAAGYFYITTEVGGEVTHRALREIYYELQRLREELIPEEELTLVKNFLMGEFLRSIDGPFALADRLKTVLFYGLNYNYYDSYLETIKTITPQDLRELAKKYFQKEDLYEVVVGKP